MDIRNVAIIAHVDHGKTTLVDALLRQSNTKLTKELEGSDLIMDSNELEKERGITIFSKNASVMWSPKGSNSPTKINIIDTPGHADFGGEVERVLAMADGCLLLIDAKEGPMPQTRFVLKEALAKKLKILVVINKIDKKDARIDYVLDKTFDLFIDLGADEESAYFEPLFASAKEGKAGKTRDLEHMTDITPLFDAIVNKIPSPSGKSNNPLQFLATSIVSDLHKGLIAIGRIYNGTMENNQEVAHIQRDGEIKKNRVTSLMTFVGLNRIEVEKAECGDIVAVAGIPNITIGETIADLQNPIAMPVLKIEEPTVKMTVGVNSSPFAGQEGEFKTSRQIRERLHKELETDTALRVEDQTDGAWVVSGRGELHLAILIERMRREGYEFAVSRPHVIEKNINGEKQTPYERVFIEAPMDYQGIVMQKMGMRHGELIDLITAENICFMEFVIATKELFGYRSEFLTDTRGLGIINTSFLEYRKDLGSAFERQRGSMISHESGVTNLYGLVNAQDRGILFVGPAVNVYMGQVIGQNARSDDMRVNVCKTKQLSNMRSKGDGGTEHFNTPKVMGLEDALEYVSDDELVEVTPKSIRIRKKILDEVEARRKKSQGIL